MEDKINDILTLAARLRAEGPYLRRGQCVFNASYMIVPEKADLLRGTIVDCFYRDDLVDEFLTQLAQL